MNNPTISRTAQCDACLVYGVHVDTTAGEITDAGVVVGIAHPSEHVYLMTGADGRLLCDDCADTEVTA